MSGTRRDSWLLARPLTMAVCVLVSTALAAPAAALPAADSAEAAASKPAGAASLVTGPVQEVTDPVTQSEPVMKLTDTTKEPSQSVDDATGGLSGAVIETVTGVTGFGGEDKDPTKGRKKNQGGAGPDKKNESAVARLIAGSREPTALPGYVLDRNRTLGFDLLSTTARDLTGAISPPPASAGILEQIAQAALEAAKRLAFPFPLALLLGLFVLFHGRFDGREPKLALAPVHGETELLRFR